MVSSQSSQPEVTLLDSISLTNLGTYMFFEEVSEESSLDLCEYLIKANLVLHPKDTLTLFLNSPGGSCTDGWAIIDLMEMSKVDIQTVAVGCIASMAVPIFIAGTKGKRIMTPHAAIMTHQFSTVLWGKSHELIAARKFHDHLDQQFIDHFLRHTKMTEKQIREVLMRPSDTWLTPEECLDYGICDEIRNPWETEEELAAVKTKAKKPKAAKPLAKKVKA